MQLIAPLVAAAMTLPMAAPLAPTARTAPRPAAAMALPATATAKVSSLDGERVLITTRDKPSLVGSYFAPRKARTIAPAALLLHDAGSDRSVLEGVASRMNRSGFAVLMLDLRGHGESCNEEQNWTSLDEDARRNLWASSMRDLETAASYLLEKAEVHSTSLTVVGHGAGCNLAARYAVRDENVRALALMSPEDEEHEMGFDLISDICDLAGLPTYLAVPRSARARADELLEYGHEANGGIEFIEIALSKKDAEEIPADAKVQTGLAKWALDKALPKRD